MTARRHGPQPGEWSLPDTFADVPGYHRTPDGADHFIPEHGHRGPAPDPGMSARKLRRIAARGRRRNRGRKR